MPEELIDAATGLQGSSPAYFYRMASAMAKWGEGQGIPYDQALRLSVQSMSGAAHMMAESSESPEELLARVTSKGGTTLAALSAFDECCFETMMNQALRRCKEQAAALGAEAIHR
jgi:pyrroline-5-carboxylate reductase